MKKACSIALLLALATLVVFCVTSDQKPSQIGSPDRPAIRHLPHVDLTEDFAVPVLMYHRICRLSESDKRSPLIRDLTVSPEDFEEQVKYLVDHGFAFLFAGEVADAVRLGRPLPERSVVLTMDDGYRDNFEYAFPILRKYHVPATIFVITSVVGDAKHLSWSNIKEMKVGGVGYGSHTVHHYDLTTLPLDRLDYELRESKRVMEDQLLERISAVAYPSGEYDQRVADRTKAAGYLAGWKKGGGPVQPEADTYLLPRIRVHGRTALNDFKRKVWSGRYTMAMQRAE